MSTPSSRHTAALTPFWIFSLNVSLPFVNAELQEPLLGPLALWPYVATPLKPDFSGRPHRYQGGKLPRSALTLTGSYSTSYRAVLVPSAPRARSLRLAGRGVVFGVICP